LHAGDELRVDTGGGGGYGIPWQRDPLLVADDVRDGKISREAAWCEYGVAVTAEGTLDAAETTRRRHDMAACNAVGQTYDRGEGR
jgi:N-methylhydantoinase B